MKEGKQSGKFIIVFAVVALLGLVTIAGLTFLMDPFFQYHMPWFGKETYVDDERYQNPGLAKNADYDAIIVGSSMSENFNCEWFDEAYGVSTLKLTYSGCTGLDWINAVNLAMENQNIKYVFGNIDMYLLEQPYNKVAKELPEYLYDNNYFNDVNYLLNKDIFFDRTINTLNNKYIGNLKSAYSFYGNYKNKYNYKSVFSIRTYKGECKNIEQKTVKIDENTRKVVGQIKETILKYPDTQFEVFYSPFSIIYFYSYALYGEIDRIMDIYIYSMKEFLECENCRLYFPAYNNIEMITDLNSYMDLAHYDMDIQYTIFEEIRDGVNMVTKDNYEDIINWFKNEIINYDYRRLYDLYEEVKR